MLAMSGKIDRNHAPVSAKAIQDGTPRLPTSAKTVNEQQLPAFAALYLEHFGFSLASYYHPAGVAPLWVHRKLPQRAFHLRQTGRRAANRHPSPVQWPWTQQNNHQLLKVIIYHQLRQLRAKN